MAFEGVTVTPRLSIRRESVDLAVTLFGVIAPSERVIAGVVVGLATVPETPFAATTEVLVTEPPMAVEFIV